MAENEVHGGREREDALEDLRRAERLTILGRLAGHIAHELGTPLNVISGRASMIAAGETTGEETTQSARIIVEQANKLTATIRQFLAEARRPMSKQRADLLPLCRQAMNLVSYSAEKAKIDISLDPESVDANLNIEPIKFVQVLTNLLTNAIEAMPSGGSVTIAMKKETRAGTPVVSVSVKDEGEGIPAENIPNIFKLFYSTRGGSGGTGLGLAIVQGIVRDSSGWVDVSSEVGKGSLFTVSLPERGN
jgi:signal transduction histidine kinase